MNCPKKSKDVPKPTAGDKKGSEMLATTRVDKPSGAGLRACDYTDATARGSGECWISDSGATVNMILDPTGFERYETAPPGRTAEMGDEMLLPVAGYEDLRLGIEQDDADGDQTRDLMLRRGAPMLGFKRNFRGCNCRRRSSVRCSCGYGPLFSGARATDSLFGNV